MLCYETDIFNPHILKYFKSQKKHLKYDLGNVFVTSLSLCLRGKVLLLGNIIYPLLKSKVEHFLDINVLTLQFFFRSK